MSTSHRHALPVAVRGGEDGSVVVSGEVDVLNAPELRACLARCIADGFFEITVDLSALTFIDSSGIAVLVVTLRDLEPHGGRLVIRHAPAQACKVLEITGLGNLVDMIPEDENGARA